MLRLVFLWPNYLEKLPVAPGVSDQVYRSPALPVHREWRRKGTGGGDALRHHVPVEAGAEAAPLRPLRTRTDKVGREISDSRCMFFLVPYLSLHITLTCRLRIKFFSMVRNNNQWKYKKLSRSFVK